MKRFIFLIMILCSSVFSSENEITKDDMVWRMKLITLGTHKLKETDWGKKVIQPKECKEDIETKLENISMVSTNILNIDPNKWLDGKYLEYFNSVCITEFGLRTSKEYFENKINEDLSLIRKGESPGVKSSNNAQLFGLYFSGLIFIALFGKFINRKRYFFYKGDERK